EADFQLPRGAVDQRHEAAHRADRIERLLQDRPQQLVDVEDRVQEPADAREGRQLRLLAASPYDLALLPRPGAPHRSPSDRPGPGWERARSASASARPPALLPPLAGAREPV